MDFKQSATRENLMRAFSGESQARNRYTFAAEKAEKAQLYFLHRLFIFTAEQERAHAWLFYQQLQPFSGESLTAGGDYPVELSLDLGALLFSAQGSEYREHDILYAAFSQTAREEGFAPVAALFDKIAAIEKAHGDRFGYYGKLLQEGRLFDEGQDTAWLCLNCGHIHQGPAAPATCPVCSHAQGYFIRAADPGLIRQG